LADHFGHQVLDGAGRHFRWETVDLVWNLELSSLLVGYALIVWSLFGPSALLAGEGRRVAAVAAFVGGIFMLAFFTVHFGMFHLVYAVVYAVYFFPWRILSRRNEAAS
jgi:hypothetical protein